MTLKNKVSLISTNILVGLLAFSITGCGNSNNSNSGNVGLGGNHYIPVNVLDEVTKDLVVEDGDPIYDDTVELKIWSINGDPDRMVQEKLFNKFNEYHKNEIHLSWTHIGHYEFYNTLETTWSTEKESIPDILFMHNEKKVQYANLNYLWPLDDLFGDEATGIEFDFEEAYPNIDRTCLYDNNRFAIPVDAHGFLTYLRQDIIKKNELGFDNNTRFIPQSKAEYEALLEGLRAKADAGELWTRNINKDEDHSWVKANKNDFYPSFMQSTNPDGLSSLYANGGTLLSEDQSTVTYQDNLGFQTYLTDQVERYQTRLMGDGDATALYGAGNIVMFSEGPWYASQTYDPIFNHAQLGREGFGITLEDAKDPVYAKPFVAAHPDGWWTLEENENLDSAHKWYGNGHSISITRQCKSLKKIAAALDFAKWYTQETDDVTDVHHLTTWCSSGHVPAWKNVYESDDYQAEYDKNLTLRALGDPADIIAMEGLVYETNVFGSFDSLCYAVHTNLRTDTATKENTIQLIKDSASGLQDFITSKIVFG